jgi:hypothetical protein
MSQPAIARLESGAHSPTFPTFLHISNAPEIALAIDITPSGHEPQLVGTRARPNALESFQGSGYTVVIAATSAQFRLRSNDAVVHAVVAAVSG